MGAVIGQAQSIRFREVNSNLPSFDNTLLANEKFYNDKIFTYCQRFESTHTETIQIKTDSDTLPTVVATKADRTTVSITPTGSTYVSRYDISGDGSYDLWYFEFDVVMSLYAQKTFITVTQGTDEWVSEPFIGDSNLTTEINDGEVLKIEYFNNDNAYQIDFSTGITFTLYVESIMKDYDTGGEIFDYDNQTELTKLKETVQRLLTFRSLHIPRYLAETLKLASSMDEFTVNDISYVRSDQPDISPVEGSNLVEYSMTLNDKEYLGVNTHDIGYDCDTASTEGDIMILTQENASGSVTFSIPAGYLVHTLRGQWVSGTSVGVKLGTSIGGDDLVLERFLNSTDTDRTTAIHGDIDRDADTDIYATVTGGVANLDLQLIQNKEI